MTKKLNIHTVFNTGKGMWENKESGVVLSRHKTQDNAQDKANRLGRSNPLGAELSIHRKDNGQIREKNTINPAHDPRSIKG